MALTLSFPTAARRRRGVSELYASMLMVGVTLSLGGFVAMAALGQLGLAANSASLGASLGQSSAGIQLGFVYAAVASSGACPAYQGYHEGTSLAVSLYNYGSVNFTPSELVVNSSVYSGSYSVLRAGSLSTYTLTMGTCAHASGLTVLLVDSMGDEVQLAA